MQHQRNYFHELPYKLRLPATRRVFPAVAAITENTQMDRASRWQLPGTAQPSSTVITHVNKTGFGHNTYVCWANESWWRPGFYPLEKNLRNPARQEPEMCMGRVDARVAWVGSGRVGSAVRSRGSTWVIQFAYNYGKFDVGRGTFRSRGSVGRVGSAEISVGRVGSALRGRVGSGRKNMTHAHL